MDVEAVCCVFHPYGYTSHIDKYRAFIRRLLAQHVPILTLEVVREDRDDLELPDLGQRVLRLTQASPLWQKERLINFAISQEFIKAKKVVWLDTDVLLENGWWEQIRKDLETHDIVQPFMRCIHMTHGNYEPSVGTDHSCHGVACAHGWCAPRSEAHCRGLAWGADIEILKKFPLYDRHILGGNDRVWADAVCGYPYVAFGVPKLDQHALNYYWKLRTQNFRVGYSRQLAWHIWHGDLRNRRHPMRDQILADADYDPEIDVVEEQGLRWSSAKPLLHENVVRYFVSRRE
jgi:hypothetical protein